MMIYYIKNHLTLNLDSSIVISMNLQPEDKLRQCQWKI
jgi:hypothetical protein